MNLTLGYAVPMLPLQDSARITVANALQAEWSEVIPPTTSLYVMGNPPFLGDHTRGADQLADLREAWGGNKVLSRLDYVTGWHAKALTLFRNPRYRGQWAFVTTNSITQGDQPARLFGPIFEAGWRIKFAHQTFAWSSEAPGAAAVHCVIVGFTQDAKARARLFTYPNIKGAPTEVPVRIGINAYLRDAVNILVEKRSGPLSGSLAEIQKGSMPTDGGNFAVEREDYAQVAEDPVAAKYVRRYVGARELLRAEDRWCLWLEGMDPADLSRSRILRERVDAVKAFRASSTAASTRDYPHHHLFRQPQRLTEHYACIPSVVSETRRYFVVASLEPDVIASNLVFQCSDPDGFQFAILSSSMFITWQKAIGGRLESRLRFASTLTWYTLPLPAVEPADRQAIAAAGHGVLEARALHPERSLAEHYNPLAMDPALVKAHDALDRLVDRAFGAKRKMTSNDERSKLLFDQYAAMATEPSS
ncbi:MAG: hypothetical protein L0G46_03050 [Kocuria sp.]|nr:hypothetical protein [Kocuria sp.]